MSVVQGASTSAIRSPAKSGSIEKKRAVIDSRVREFFVNSSWHDDEKYVANIGVAVLQYDTPVGHILVRY